ncbi:hypothetical protein DQ238_07315 [Geodermatophilus sp. TF02-6]|uniref:DUF881 domain-containing protein n=1 Tax=Geodermatophilus sp. TF02-6 TaxID=2250575 RepID=UPI000DEB1CA3|nr:DUF881 domain-containing protein [Geodermatophilus sp. TF02-6]RBY80851.1 hypothetical protein DQ238_07315 [Geodermatophilus sp. TF02-6]
MAGARSLTRRGARGRSGWAALVPVVALAAGLLFATSSQTAQGTDLRGGEVTELSALIAARQDVLVAQEEQLAALQARAQALTDQAASRDGAVAAAQARTEAGVLSAGLVALSGRGVEITLDDAPRRPDGSLPIGARPDDVVIHQSDVQAVVNAVWAAGADAVAVMDQRLIATSAVRCVGNVLLLQGRTYSPPFVVTAIGDAAAIRAQLAASPQVALFQQAVDDYGLGFAVRDRSQVTVPAYDGPLDMEYATAADG